MPNSELGWQLLQVEELEDEEKQYGDAQAKFRLNWKNPPMTTWHLPGCGSGAFLRHAFMANVPEGIDLLEIRESDTEELSTDYAEVVDAIEVPPDEPIKRTLLLRVYDGTNTRITDITDAAWDGFWSLAPDVVEGAAFVVGRVCVPGRVRKSRGPIRFVSRSWRGRSLTQAGRR